MARAARRPSLLTPTFLLLTFASFGYFMAVGMQIPTIPLYVKGPLGGGDVAVGFVGGSFAFTALVLRPLAGRLADRRGRRLGVVAGIGLGTLISLGLVVAKSIPALFALRLASGVAEALFFVCSAAAINDLAPDERRGEAVSLFSLALYGGLALGPLAGESVLHAAGYDAVWIASAGVGLLAFLLSLRAPETRPEDLEITAQRLVHPAAIRPGSALLVSIMGFSGFMTFVPLYVRELGLSGSRYAFLLFSSIVFLVRSAGASLPDRMGLARAARTAVVLSAVGLGVIGAWRSGAGLYAGTAVYGIGIGLSFPALMSLAVGNAPKGERGSVVGTFTAFIDLGFGTGPVVLGTVAGAAGYPNSFLVGAGIAATGLLMLYRIRAPAPTED